MNKTGIEYLTHTWNPIAMRCTPVSEACDNCWHLDRADNFAKIPLFSDELRAIYRGDAPPKLIESRLSISNKPGKRIGVQFMGDLFHEKINIFGPELRSIFRTMAASDATFLILTKRSQRMADCIEFLYGKDFAEMLPNVWLGVTAENQKRADERIPTLLQIPAAVRFVSIEPMLGPVDFNALSDGAWNLNALTGLRENPFTATVTREYGPKLDWVICAPETGSKRRDYDIEWICSLKKQCVESGTPFFLKHLFDGKKKIRVPGLDGQKWTQLP